MPSTQLNVFVSATTADLGAWRKATTGVLLTAGIHPVVQENFPPDYRGLLEVLNQKVGDCDAVICIVGTIFGSMPESTESPPRSYTQIEYDVARALNKPIFVLMTSPTAELHGRSSESVEQQHWQEAHRHALLKNHKVEWISSQQDLELKVAQAVLAFRDLAGWRGNIHYLHPPKPPSYFAGREMEMAQLSAALQRKSPSIVVVLGMGGQGKTTLAYQTLKNGGGFTFATGFWCTAYRGGFSFDMFLDAALDHLTKGKFDKRQMPEERQRSTYLIRLLQERPIFLIIDGIERWLKGWESPAKVPSSHSVEDRKGQSEVLDEFLAEASALANGCHLILTSRALPAVLDDGLYAVVPVYEPGKRMSLEGLEDEAAIALLNSFGVQGSFEELLRSARIFGKHPLALTVLGGYSARIYGGRLPPIAHASLLDPKQRLFQLLDETRLHLPHPRRAERFLQVAAHFIDKVALNAMNHVLPQLQQPISNRVKQWWSERSQGQHTIKAAREASVREMAVSLSDWHLLSWDGASDTFHLHPLIKEYFLSGTVDSEAVHKLISNWYAAQPLVERPTSIESIRSRWLAVEHGLRAKDLVWCTELMFGPFIPGYTFSEWLAAWGHLDSGIALLERLGEAAKGQLRGQFLLARSAMLHQSGRFQQSLGDIDEAISIFDQEDAPAAQQINLAKALSNRANMHREIGRSSVAVADYNSAISILESAHEQDATGTANLALALVNRGNALLDLGKWSVARSDYDRACACYTGVLSILGEVGEGMLAGARVNRGIVLAELGEIDGALSDFREAISSLEHLQQIGHQDFEPRLAHAQVMLGATLREANAVPEALNCLHVAIERLQRLVDAGRKDVESLLALAWMNRSDTELTAKNYPLALAAAQSSASIYQRLIAEGHQQVEGSLGHVLLIRAEIRHLMGEYADAQSDRSVGFATLRKLMTEWVGESDIQQVFLKKSCAAIAYLVADDRREAVALFDELAPELARHATAPDTEEGLRMTSRRCVLKLRLLLPRLAAAGAKIDLIQKLTV